jgi:HNH endonuclease
MSTPRLPVDKPTDECVIWSGPCTAHGYGMVYRSSTGTRKILYAHRVAWEDRYGPIPAGGVVHHECGNRACINVDHLRLVRSQSEHAKGHAQLSALHQEAMVDLRQAGWSNGKIAALLGVSKQAVIYRLNRDRIRAQRLRRGELKEL